MAQFKDLLVTGPVRIIGDINFNKLPKYNNINLATANDISNVATAAATAQSKADDAYGLASQKTTMEEVEEKGYATISQAQGYANAVLGDNNDNSGAATVYGANKAASDAAVAAANAYGRANSVLTESKDYADDTTAALKNDLLNGAGKAYDTLKELGDLINTNTGAIDALETIAAFKADKRYGNEFDGEQKMLNKSYCGTMYDIASGIGCSLKNTRALDNQAIIGELLLPYTSHNGDGTANTCQVTAGEMGIYKIDEVYPNGDANYAKIKSKTLVGKFTNNGWIGNVTGALSGNATTSSYPIGFTGRSSSASWGLCGKNSAYIFIDAWCYNNPNKSIANAEVAFFAKDKTSSSAGAGEISMQIDGYFYQCEGDYQVLDTRNVSGTASYIPKFTAANSIGNGWQIKNQTTAGSSDWTNTTTDGGLIPTMNTIAYWNGAYSDAGGSNLAYCNQGAFGSMATKTVDAMNCDILFSNSGTNFRQIRGTVGDNDYWRIGGGATASNGGYMEIATSDDGNEPIYVRQYTGVYTTLTRTATLLDASGNTIFPGTVTVGSHGTFTYNTADKCIDIAFN